MVATGYLLFSTAVDHVIFCLLGLVVSVYSLYVEIRKHKDPKYVAMCDFNEHMSCSKVLTSEYSKGFGVTRYLFGKESTLNVPNCTVGIIFYTVQLILGFLPYPLAVHMMFYMSIVSCLGSLYLAYILFFVLHDVCIVCIATYIINASLMYLNAQWQLHI